MLELVWLILMCENIVESKISSLYKEVSKNTAFIFPYPKVLSMFCLFSSGLITENLKKKLKQAIINHKKSLEYLDAGILVLYLSMYMFQ